MSSYLLAPEPIFSACAIQMRQSVSGCVMQKGSLGLLALQMLVVMLHLGGAVGELGVGQRLGSP